MSLEYNKIVFIFLVVEATELHSVLSKKSVIMKTMEVDQLCCILLQSGIQVLCWSRNVGCMHSRWSHHHGFSQLLSRALLASWV